MTMTAEARALASPLRLRILRICLHEPHTNKEIAQSLGMNPGSTLHHVRTLVRTGFLQAGEPRRGKRGAREVPYLATKRSWDTPVPGIGPILIQTFGSKLPAASTATPAWPAAAWAMCSAA